MILKTVSPVLLVVFALLFSGCDSGPATGLVTGVVTIDGNPVADATVSFYPAQGRASTARTDENGKYELSFSRQKKGAVLGEHKVTIITEVLTETDYGASDDYANREGDESLGKIKNRNRAEMLPSKYRDRKLTDLTANVEPGENVFDFPLSTK